MGERYVDTKKHFVVHPDTLEASKKYTKGNRQAFKEMAEERNVAVENNMLYHNPDHDAEMLETAEERTLAAAALGWRWKPSKHKTKGG